MSQKRIGLIAHPGKPGAAEAVNALHAGFTRRSAEVHVEKVTAVLAGLAGESTVGELAQRCELLVVLGGDGTILNVVHGLDSALRPIFGINLGSLGFLTCLSANEYLRAVDCVMDDAFTLSQRTLLAVEVIRGGQIASRQRGLNDAVISRGALSRLIKLETRINDALLTEYNGDGLIVATPTGSTAYSLSAGGPLLTPESNVFAITPICPHSLTDRSVIIEDRSCVKVHLREQQGEMFLTVDGQRSVPLQLDDSLRIRRAETTLPLAMLPDKPFLEVVRRKLKWSGSSL